MGIAFFLEMFNKKFLVVADKKMSAKYVGKISAQNV